MARRREPTWLTRRIVDVIHDAQLREHGGTPGVRDAGLLDSTIARARQKWAYGEKVDFATLAAAYAFGLAKNQGYIDGNKRVAFMAGYVFLRLNGYDVDAVEADVAGTIASVPAARLSERAMAEWFGQHVRPLTSPEAEGRLR